MKKQSNHLLRLGRVSTATRAITFVGRQEIGSETLYYFMP